MTTPIKKRSDAIQDVMEQSMADMLVSYFSYVCRVLPVKQEPGVTLERELAQLVVELLLHADGMLLDPVVRAEREIRAAEKAGHPVPGWEQERIADEAMFAQRFWRGSEHACLRDVLSRCLLETDFSQVPEQAAYEAMWEAVRLDYDRETEAYAEADAWKAQKQKAFPVSVLPGDFVELGSGFGVAVSDGKNIAYVLAREPDAVDAKDLTEAHVPGRGPMLFGADRIVRRDDVKAVVSRLDDGEFSKVMALAMPALLFCRGSCIRYMQDGEARYGLIAGISPDGREYRVIDVFRLTEAEASSDPAYIQLADGHDLDYGRMLFEDLYDAPHMHAYVHRGGSRVIPTDHSGFCSGKRVGGFYPGFVDSGIECLSSLVE